MTHPPSGTVTFLFTDIEGSTELGNKFPAHMPNAKRRHHELLRTAIEEFDGFVFNVVGDEFCAAFASAHRAAAAAVRAQEALVAQDWGEIHQLKVRMGLHTGSVEWVDDDYNGSPVDHAAHLMATGHGGQILLSLVTSELLQEPLPDGLQLKELGSYRVKGLLRDERVFQLIAPGLVHDFPPLRLDGGEMSAEERFFASVAKVTSPTESAIARSLLEFGESLTERRARWGKGSKRKSFAAHMSEYGQAVSVFSVYTTGKFSFNAGWNHDRLEALKPGLSEHYRLEAQARLGVHWDPRQWQHGWPLASLSKLAPDNAESFKALITEFVEEVRQALVDRDRRQRKINGKNPTRTWDESTLLADLAARRGTQCANVAKEIIAWARKRQLSDSWGTGNRDGSFIPSLDVNGIGYWPIALYSSGRVYIQLNVLRTRPPFDSGDAQAELLESINSIPGIKRIDSIHRQPSIDLELFRHRESLDAFLTIVGGVFDKASAMRGGTEQAHN